MKRLWSVWVGGIEVNDFALSYEDAETLAKQYLDDDYDDVEMTYIEV